MGEREGGRSQYTNIQFFLLIRFARRSWRKKAKGEGDAIPGILSEMMSSGEQRSPKDWNKAKKLRNALEPEYGHQYKKRDRR